MSFVDSISGQQLPITDENCFTKGEKIFHSVTINTKNSTSSAHAQICMFEKRSHKTSCFKNCTTSVLNLNSEKLQCFTGSIFDLLERRFFVKYDCVIYQMFEGRISTGMDDFMMNNCKKGIVSLALTSFELNYKLNVNSGAGLN